MILIFLMLLFSALFRLLCCYKDNFDRNTVTNKWTNKKCAHDLLQDLKEQTGEAKWTRTKLNDSTLGDYSHTIKRLNSTRQAKVCGKKKWNKRNYNTTTRQQWYRHSTSPSLARNLLSFSSRQIIGFFMSHLYVKKKKLQ